MMKMGSWCLLCHLVPLRMSPLTHQAATSWAQVAWWGPSSKTSVFLYSSQLCAVAMDTPIPLPLELYKKKKANILLILFGTWEATRPWPNSSTWSCLSLPTCKVGRRGRGRELCLLTLKLCDAIPMWWWCPYFWVTLGNWLPLSHYVYFDVGDISFFFFLMWPLRISLLSFPSTKHLICHGKFI